MERAKVTFRVSWGNPLSSHHLVLGQNKTISAKGCIYSFIHSPDRYEVTGYFGGKSSKARNTVCMYPCRAHSGGRGINWLEWATLLCVGNLSQHPNRPALEAFPWAGQGGAYAAHHQPKLAIVPFLKASLLLSQTARHLIPPQKQDLSVFSPPYFTPPLATWLI